MIGSFFMMIAMIKTCKQASLILKTMHKSNFHLFDQNQNIFQRMNGDWFDYYQDDYDNKYTRPNRLTQIKSGSTYICDAQFINLKRRGVVRVESNSYETNVLIENCKFEKCSHDNLPGGCVFMSGKGQCIQTKVISTESKVRNTFGSYCSTTTKTMLQQNNFILQSSIAKIDNMDSSEPIRLNDGECHLYDTNFSYNSMQAKSGFVIRDVEQIAMIRYSNFMNNSQSLYSFFQIESKVPPLFSHSVESCNFIGNIFNGNHLLATFITTQCYVLNIKDSCFSDNKYGKLIENNDKINVENSYLQNEFKIDGKESENSTFFTAEHRKLNDYFIKSTSKFAFNHKIANDKVNLKIFGIIVFIFILAIAMIIVVVVFVYITEKDDFRAIESVASDDSSPTQEMYPELSLRGQHRNHILQ